MRPAAVRDLDAIADHTLAEWGEAQRNAYVSRLLDAFDQIGEMPEIGRLRPGMSRPWRGYPVSRHIVFYLLIDDAVDIVRILHQTMDLRRHLS